MAKTAAELMAELANDKQHQAKKAENERKTDELKNICERDEKDLVRDINNNGFSIKSVWDFVNSQNDYFDAIPVLINHLKIEHHPKILAGIARSLAVPQLADNDELWLILVGHYRSICDLINQVSINLTIMEPQYRIMEQSTTGWVDWNEQTPSMTKEDCQELYRSLLGDGMNPQDIKIVRVS